MSIGKKLLELRQRRGLSQEELANHLHVSRQTISKWESDLSLPDMKMMLELSEYYSVPITELLGIDNQEESQISAQRIYEQTNLVLENIQIDTHKRKNRDLIIIVGICITCFISIIFSIILFTRLSRLESTQKNNRIIVNENTVYEEKSNIQGFEISSGKEKYNLQQKTIQVYYECTLKNYNDKTKVNLIMVDKNKKEYQYEMEKKNGYTFVYDKQIPLIDYQSLKVNVDNGTGEKEVWDTNNSIEYLTKTFIYTVGLEMPKLDNGRLIRNEIHYVPKTIQSYDTAEYKESFDEKMTIIFYKTINNELKEVKREDVQLNEKKVIKIGFEYKSNDYVHYKLLTVINGQEIEINSNKQLIENTYPKDPYQLMDYDNYY